MLDGTFTVGGLQPVPGGSGAGITIRANGTMEIDTGCNTGSADVSFRGENSMIVGPLTLTEKACTGDEGMEAEMVFVLSERITWSVTGDVLALTPTDVSDTGLHLTASAQR